MATVGRRKAQKISEARDMMIAAGMFGLLVGMLMFWLGRYGKMWPIIHPGRISCWNFGADRK